MKENIYLRKIRKREGEWDTNVYPFSIPVIRDFTEFRFEKSVTYIIGGNGSGKSTLLEAIAVLLRINPEGGSRHFNFHTEETHSALHEALIASQASLSYNDTYFFNDTLVNLYNVFTVSTKFHSHIIIHSSINDTNTTCMNRYRLNSTA